MALTPADVHNVAFSKPRIGKRGYDEQEVDLFLDLVEQELIRHISEEAQLRNLNAELRDRDGGMQKRDAELAEREAKLAEWEGVLRRHVREHESRLRQQKAEAARRETKLARQGSPLPQQLAQLRHREAQIAQREAELESRESTLAQWEAQLGRQQAELTQWQADLRQEDGDIRRRRVEAEPATDEVPPSLQQQLVGALSKPAAVNGTSRPGETRAVAGDHGRHDMERMAIRAVTDPLGNTVTETIHERTRRRITDGCTGAGSEQSAELEQLREQNAELARTLGLLKPAAALLASALNQP